MSRLADRRQRLLDALYAEYGESAQWTPAVGGEAAAITVRRRVEDGIVKFGEASAIERTNVLRIRASELAAPAIGDQAALADPVTGAPQTLTVTAQPRLAEDRPEWICEVA